MKLYVQRLALVAALLLLAAVPAFSQSYPLPAKNNQAPVICTGCIDVNASLQPNDGLKLWPYADPLIKHAGRILDSTTTADYQDRGGGTGMRTLRAGKIRFAREQRGNAPPRMYMLQGSTIGIYTIDKFFSTTLPSGPVPVSSLTPWSPYDRNPSEVVSKWDRFIYPEHASSGWQTMVIDGQDRMYDFDFDDRGYVYAAAGVFGLGIMKDEEGSGHLPLVKQLIGDSNPSDITPSLVLSVRIGSKYYAVIATRSNAGKGRAVFDVTNPSSPTLYRKHTGLTDGFTSWAKSETTGDIATVTGDGKVLIFDPTTFVNGGAPLATFEAGNGLSYADVAADAEGNFWTGEYTTKTPPATSLVRMSPTGAQQKFPISGTFVTKKINYGENYIVAVGQGTGSTGGVPIQLRLYKLEGGTPIEVNLGEFFTKHYHRSPSDYAQPPSSKMSTIHGGNVIKSGGKTYLLYSADGIGDAYELQAGDSISASRKSATSDTANPYSKATESGPFYGDLLRFNAKSSNPNVEYDVQWNFANPESGTANTTSSRTPNDVEHRYTGLTTAAAITASKSVVVTAAVNSEITDTLAVTMKVPSARIGVAGQATAMATDGSIDLAYGEQLTDASDGTVQGHYSAWTVDGTPTNKLPNQPVDAGGFGAHTASLTAKYGSYDSAFTTVGSPFTDTVNVSYIVKPFLAAFAPSTTASGVITFNGTARTGSVTGISQWTVTWSLKDAAGAEITSRTQTEAFGTISGFPVNLTSIVNNSVLTLTVAVDSSLLDPAAANYASYSVSQTLAKPDPKITKDGCLLALEPCSFTLGSLTSQSMSDWAITWTLKRNGVTVGTSSKSVYTPTISDAGSYTISVKAITGLGEGNANDGPWTVEPPACTAPPSSFVVATSCDTCAVGETVRMWPEVWGGYDWQNCTTFTWEFGDGSAPETTTTPDMTHAYASAGKPTITLTVTKANQTIKKSIQITIGSVYEPPPTEPPPTTCTAPTNIQISYSGSKGCNGSKPCKVGEQVTYTAKRGSGALQSCDGTTWTFHDGTSSSKNPKKTYTATGNYPVKVVVSNTKGSSQPVEIVIPIVEDTGSCGAPPTVNDAYITYRGVQSGCSDGNPAVLCQTGEVIEFEALPFLGFSFKDCDRFEWDFADGSALSAEPIASHSYTTAAASYRVKLRVYNTNNSTGTTFTVDVPFSNVAAKPLPVLSFAGFPSTGAKNTTVMFTVSSDIDATGWSWDFGDGKKDTTQATLTGKSTTITHTYTKTGTFNVSVKARNAADVATAPLSVALGTIKIDDVPEFRYLLPVTVHAPGQGGSVWRTDVQIYNPDPNVSAANPLRMTATFNGAATALEIPHSTYIYEDFLQSLTTADAQGPVIISTTAAYAPQIWTRTYNQAEGGTFGQFIPAIRLDAAGGGGAVGDGRYFLAGLKNDARYRTNIGLVNPTPLPLTATVHAFDESGLPILNGTFTRTLNPYQLDQFPIGAAIPNFPADRSFSLEVEVAAGQWLIAYASFIDGGSNDPVYLQAVRESELVSEDYRSIVIPGVGHIGAWRSDVTIYNSNGHRITVDLAYHDQTGAKVGEALNVPIGGGEFLLYADLLKQGILGGSVPDSLGILRVSVPSAVSAERFPMTFARTYNDNGSGKTYGQGIAGFAAARANVKANSAGLIPAVRSKAGQYYTNVFVTNVTDTPVAFSITVLDPATGATVRQDVHELGAHQTLTRTKFDLGEGRETASLKIAATGNVWAYASIVDDRTFDPEYVPATPIAP